MTLSVAVLTFNHETCIRQALDSILAQKVDFEYEIVVGDDCSSDGTREILNEYAARFPSRIKLILNETNLGIAKNYQKVLTTCRGEYIALLEGDDYWLDKDKLQNQVDFLNTHPDYGFVGAYNKILDRKGRISDEKKEWFECVGKEGEWMLYDDLSEYARYGPLTRTATLCFRRKILEPYLCYAGAGCDVVLQLILMKHSKFARQSRFVAVYRGGGVSTSSMEYYNEWIIENRRLQKKLFPEDCNWDEDQLDDLQTYYRLKQHILHFDYEKALRCKSSLKSECYRSKACSRYFSGPVSMVMLACSMRLSKLFKYGRKY